MMRILLAAAMLACPAVASAAYSDVVKAEGTLLHYWPMTDNAGCSTIAEDGPGAITLTVAGATCGVSGQVGTAVSFDGVNDCLSSTSAIDLSAHNRIVVELLWKAPGYDGVTEKVTVGFAGAGRFLFTQDNTGGNAGSMLALLEGNVGLNYMQMMQVAAPTSWHHLVFDYDMSLATDEVNVYVDGALVTPTARPANANNTGTFGNTTFNVGCYAGPVSFANGEMQHVAIYSGLSAARILAHYQSATRTSYTFTVNDFWSNGYDNVAEPRQSNMARAVITTSSPTLYVTGTSDLFGINPAFAELYVLQAGTLVDTLNFAADAQEEFTVTLGSAGTPKTVEIVNGIQSHVGANHYGSYIDAVAVPSAYSITVNAPSVPGNRILFYGDSIISGADATNVSPEGVVEQLRNVYHHNTMQEAWGVRSLWDDRSFNFAPLAARLASYSPATVWIAIGVNDWQYGNYLVADFDDAYQTMVAAIQAARPGVRIICQTPTTKSTEPTPNGNGETLEQFRAAIRTACGNRNAKVVEGPTLFDVADTTDGLHPTTAGHEDYARNANVFLSTSRRPKRLGHRGGIRLGR